MQILALLQRNNSLVIELIQKSVDNLLELNLENLNEIEEFSITQHLLTYAYLGVIPSISQKYDYVIYIYI